MALQKSIVLDTGVECPEVYIKINGIAVNYNDLILDIELYYYYNKQTRLENKLPIKKEYINMINVLSSKDNIENIFNNDFNIDNLNQEGNNFIKQGYICLKTLPQFSDCIDII